MRNQKLFLLIFLLSWYYIFYLIFFNKNSIVEEYPQLRARFGTILSHSSDRNGRAGEAMYDPNSVPHNYCYYPKGATQYSNMGGEYIIKREDSGDCKGWYGQVIFYEGSWVSEREKIWWNKEQQLAEQKKN